MNELCNILPEPTVKVYIPEYKAHFLKLQFTGVEDENFDFKNKKNEKTRPQNLLFRCDYEDWLKARCCMWWWDEAIKQPVNAVGIKFTDYVGIKASRLTSGVEKYNFCRSSYGN